ncbi:39S ribosomal protein L3, mitochondrial-like isoform X1 [Dendronephthya gigantea]|uniref:39S ribosomal protein L3, mitochondrial-like isoform X1 n=2 Tax=Dendronephthya gigantea TaxID=151771 RepID=UPI00106CED62|nr:39S ribosomal protein L3, mitochondrial-like isoform X1 [Dendronephthya gigantea]
MADCKVVFACLFSSVSRHPRCVLNTLSLCRRFFATGAIRRGENDTDNATNMFEFYQKNPKHLKDLNVRDIRFDIDQELSMEKEKAERKPPVVEPEKATWSAGCKRVGAIGVKLGMIPLWLKNGRRVPVTLVQLKDCQVLAMRISRELGGNDDITALEVGAVNENDLEKVNKADFGRFVKYGVLPKRKVASFPVSPSALLLPGTEILGGHFYPGQFITVQAKSKDKGFQGVMKRWGMKGQPASHGQTKTHRKMGATGGGGTPGRIWPGKKMPGHMGNKNRTVYGTKIYRINTKYNVLYIHGQIPGPNGGMVKVQDGVAGHKEAPPYPTYLPHTHGPLPEELIDESVQDFANDSISFSKG